MKRKILLLSLLILLLSLACSIVGSGTTTTQDSPEEAVRGVLVEVAKGNREGVYRYSYDGIDAQGQWPENILSYCYDILVERQEYQIENYGIDYSSETRAVVTVSTGKPWTFSGGTVKFITLMKDGKWFVYYVDPTGLCY